MGVVRIGVQLVIMALLCCAGCASAVHRMKVDEAAARAEAAPLAARAAAAKAAAARRAAAQASEDALKAPVNIVGRAAADALKERARKMKEEAKAADVEVTKANTEVVQARSAAEAIRSVPPIAIPPIAMPTLRPTPQPTPPSYQPTPPSSQPMPTPSTVLPDTPPLSDPQARRHQLRPRKPEAERAVTPPGQPRPAAVQPPRRRPSAESQALYDQAATVAQAARPPHAGVASNEASNGRSPHCCSPRALSAPSACSNAAGSARSIFALPQSQRSSRLVRYDGGPVPWSPRQERFNPVQHLKYTSREFHVATYRECALVHDGADDDDPAPFASARGSVPPRIRERGGVRSLTSSATACSMEPDDAAPRTYPIPMPVRSPGARYARALEQRALPGMNDVEDPCEDPNSPLLS